MGMYYDESDHYDSHPVENEFNTDNGKYGESSNATYKFASADNCFMSIIKI